jgi:hypothetical protein
MQAAGAVGFAGVVAAAVAVGPGAVAAVAIAAAVLGLLDAVRLFGRAGARPVLPAAAIPGVALPVLAALEPAQSAASWGRIGEVFAVAVLAGFALVLVFGRRRRVVVGLGAAFAAGLLVGLGAASIVLLYALPGGLTWLLALLALAVAADATGPVVAAIEARRGGGATEVTQLGSAPLLVTLVVLVVLTTVLALGLDPPLTPWLAVILGAAVAVAALGGEHLRRALVVEARRAPAGMFGAGAVLGAVDALLLSAPVAYVLARAVVQ